MQQHPATEFCEHVRMSMSLGTRLRALRETRGISRKRLSELTQVGYSTIAEIENGGMRSTTKLHRLASALGVSPEYLETGKEAAPKDAPVSESQPMRLDAGLVRDVVRNLREVFAEDLQQTYNIEERPELFVELYEQYVSESGAERRHTDRWLGREIEKVAQQGAPPEDVQSQRAAEGHHETKTWPRRAKA